MTPKCKFFILAGGYGKRLQPLTAIKPKPLFPLHGSPLIRILLQQLQQKGLAEGFINLHYMPVPLRLCIEDTMGQKDPPGFHFLYEEVLSGSRILKEAALRMKEDELLLVVNGDIFLDIPFAQLGLALLEDDADGVLLVRENKEKDPQYKMILTTGDFFKGRDIFGSSGVPGEAPLMYTGVALFKQKVALANDEINFFDGLEKNESRVKVLLYDGPWLDIGDPHSYWRANLEYKRFLGIEKLNSNSCSEQVTISPDSVVEGSIIWENTEIKNKSVIKNCIVTGNMSLDNVHYENKIINRDSVLDGIVL